MPVPMSVLLPFLPPFDSDTVVAARWLRPPNVIESTFKPILSRPFTRLDFLTFTALTVTGAPRGIKTAPLLLTTGSARLPLNVEPGWAYLTSIGSIVLTWRTVPAGTLTGLVCALITLPIEAHHDRAMTNRTRFI